MTVHALPLQRPLRRLRGTPHLLTYVGLGLILAGGLLLLLAWGRVAGQISVALQMPYVISAGCSGLALVAIGLMVTSHAVKQADAQRRAAQLGELRDVLAAIATTVESLADRQAETAVVEAAPRRRVKVAR